MHEIIAHDSPSDLAQLRADAANVNHRLLQRLLEEQKILDVEIGVIKGLLFTLPGPEPSANGTAAGTDAGGADLVPLAPPGGWASHYADGNIGVGGQGHSLEQIREIVRGPHDESAAAVQKPARPKTKVEANQEIIDEWRAEHPGELIDTKVVADWAIATGRWQAPEPKRARLRKPKPPTGYPNEGTEDWNRPAAELPERADLRVNAPAQAMPIEGTVEEPAKGWDMNRFRDAFKFLNAASTDDVAVCRDCKIMFAPVDFQCPECLSDQTVSGTEFMDELPSDPAAKLVREVRAKREPKPKAPEEPLPGPLFVPRPIGGWSGTKIHEAAREMLGSTYTVGRSDVLLRYCLKCEMMHREGACPGCGSLGAGTLAELATQLDAVREKLRKPPPVPADDLAGLAASGQTWKPVDLLEALGTDRSLWARLSFRGADDDELIVAITEAFVGPSVAPKSGANWSVDVSKKLGPRYWSTPAGKNSKRPATLAGPSLLTAVRAVLQIGQPEPKPQPV
jgi:RNA polymerase subunit RPABC4/transcription elongation factor Spt4